MVDKHKAVKVFRLLGTRSSKKSVYEAVPGIATMNQCPDDLPGSESGLEKDPAQDLQFWPPTLGSRALTSWQWPSDPLCQPPPAAPVNSPFNQSAVTHIHAAATSNFSRANFFRPPSLLFDQPSRKHPHRLFRSSTSRVNSQDGYVRLNFFQAFVCKWTIGNGLCEYEGAANSPPSEEFWIERAEVVTDLLPASAAAYLSEHT